MNTLLISEVQVICTKNYTRQKVNGMGNEYFIKEVLNKMKKVIKNVSENKNLRLKKTKR